MDKSTIVQIIGWSTAGITATGTIWMIRHTIQTYRTRFHFCIIAITLSLIALSGCSSGKSNGDNSISPNNTKVTSMLFGANLSWEDLGDGAMEHCDLLYDRSFRAKADSTMANPWSEYSNGGTITWNTADQGDTNPAGGTHYPGYVEFSRTSDGYTGIIQQVKESITNNAVYQINFSSYGNGGTPEINVFLYNSSYEVIGSATATSVNNTWTQHSLDITATDDASVGYCAIYLHNSGTVRIDEVRLAEKDKAPSVKQLYKLRIHEMGIKALRWPGGTLADWFSWKDSIGPHLSRGELRAYDHYETPALGLHEFLNLCEEMGIEPLITVNIFANPSDAAEMVEYILGGDSTTQGAVRASNGRTQPWNVQYFEIGNEPAESYKGSEQTQNAGLNYAVLARNIITAMKTKAQSIGKTISVSGITEPNFQLADWLPIVNDPLVKLIYNWNGQVFDPYTGITNTIDIAHGHFYTYREYSTDEAERYRYLMAGGAVLLRTIEEKISPLIGNLPFWITEYHVVLEQSGTSYPEYTLDFQSGLSIADLILSMIEAHVSGAFIWNLSQYGMFGITGTSGNWLMKPAGLVFALLSPTAGEEILDIESSDSEVFTLTDGSGIIPSGQSYPFVSVFATKNAYSGKPRIFALNRDYASSRTIGITTEGLAAGSAIVYRYESDSLTSNNEGANPEVIIQQEHISIGNQLVITLAPHSFIRIDVE